MPQIDASEADYIAQKWLPYKWNPRKKAMTGRVYIKNEAMTIKKKK